MSFVAVGTFVVSTGLGLWGSDKAKKEAAKQQKLANQAAAAEQVAEAARQAVLQKQMEQAAIQANAQKIRDDAQLKAKKSKTTRTVTMISLIGGSLLIGITTMVVILKRK